MRPIELNVRDSFSCWLFRRIPKSTGDWIGFRVGVSDPRRDARHHPGTLFARFF